MQQLTERRFVRTERFAATSFFFIVAGAHGWSFLEFFQSG